MKHYNRLDLPKGHIEEDENDMQCALREFNEETGINPAKIEVDESFKFEEVYYPTYASHGRKAQIKKTLVVFLADLINDQQIKVSEHIGFEWHTWSPPHKIQHYTIDPLLSKVEKHFMEKSNSQ